MGTRGKEIAEFLKQEAIRVFDSGATRNNDPERVDFLRMLSLPVLFEYARYMRKHRVQDDGSLRDFDNWKGGFDQHEVCESLMRHCLDLAALEDKVDPLRECEVVDTCCAIIFNASAYLHKHLKG